MLGSSTPDLADQLTTSREYVRIRPATTPLAPAAAVRATRRLRALLEPDPVVWPGTDITIGRRQPADHTLEVLLATGPGRDAPVEYLLTIPDDAARDGLERLCRDVFPDDYRIERVDTTLAATLGLARPDDPTTLHTPAIQSGDDTTLPPITSLEVRARDEVTEGWMHQGPTIAGVDDPSAIGPPESTDSNTATAASPSTADDPLATVVATLADQRAAGIVQVLARPYSDWSSAAQRYINDLKGNTLTALGQFVDGLTADTDDPHWERPDDSPELTVDTRERIAAVRRTTPGETLACTLRAIAVDPPDDRWVTDGGTAPAAPGNTRTPTTDSEHDHQPTTADTSDTDTDPDTDHADDTTPAQDLIDAVSIGLTGLDTAYRRLVPRTSSDTVQSRLPFTDPTPGRTIAAHLADREITTTISHTQALKRRLVGAGVTRPCLVCDPAEFPLLGLLDGATLPPAAQRALERVPEERTIPTPPTQQTLKPFAEGATLGTVLDTDGHPQQQLALPPALQRLHTLIAGRSGSGKSTLLTSHLVSNVAATDGAHVLIDPKGDGLVDDYLRAHYARFGDLDDVYYFDLTEVVPELSFFDIRPALADGQARTHAIETRLDHFEEIAAALAGERYHDAIRSTDVLRLVGKAAYDPNQAGDAPTYGDLHAIAQQLRAGEIPHVAPDLERQLHEVAQLPDRTRAEIMGGVFTRLEKVGTDARIRRLFDRAPAPDTRLDLADLLDEDVVVLFDCGGLQPRPRAAVTLVLLSELWVACQRRTHHAPDADHPLVNCYLEEAPQVAHTDLLGELLSQGRGFDLAVTVLAQFPGQFAAPDDDVYAELLNNVGTILAGHVGEDRRLARRLATLDPTLETAADRLRSLDRGQWVAALPAPYGADAPQPFVLESPPPPPGDPDGDRPLGPLETRAFEQTRKQRVETVTRELARPHVDAATSATDPTSAADADGPAENAAAEPDNSADTDDGTDTADTDDDADTTDPTPAPADLDRQHVPRTRKLPRQVHYDDAADAYLCGECVDDPADATRYRATTAGLRRALACCGPHPDADRDALRRISIPALNVRPATIADSPYSLAQWRFLKTIYNVHVGAHDPLLEFDLVEDSMKILRHDFDLPVGAVDQLVDDGLLTENEVPHKTYTLRPAGRTLLCEPWTDGQEYGDGRGDLDESTQHMLLVEATRRFLEQDVAADPTLHVRPYHDVALDDARGRDARLDVAVVDDAGTVVMAAEAERDNHDTAASTRATYTKLARLDLEDAIWVVPGDREAHGIVHQLAEAGSDPDSSVDYAGTDYSDTTRVHHFSFDESGITDMYTIHQIATAIDPPWDPDQPFAAPP